MPNVEPLRPGDPAAVGPYRLVGRLGAGGQGVVYLAQARNGAPVAIKVLREDMAGDDRFARELAAARRVEPFCIAQVLDASLSGRPYIVTEYVDGPSLQQAGRHRGAELQRLAVATATALAAIHQAGVVHRDFTPSNVLLGRDGPRVIDFGIARALATGVTSTSSVVGTPAYMAPEQLAGQAVGAQADVFAWASVIVYAASGMPPFGDDSLPAVINRIVHSEPQVGALPEPLRSVVLSCLAKDPARRPTMQEVLLRLLGPGPAAPPREQGRQQEQNREPEQGRGREQAQGGPVVERSSLAGNGRTAGLGMKKNRPQRTGRTVAIAAVSGVSVLALAATIVWLTPSSPRSRTQNLAGLSTDAPSTPAAGQPTANASAAPTASAAAAWLRLRYVRAGGARQGSCYAGGEATLTGLVQRQGRPLKIEFSWVIDGVTVLRSTAIIPQDGKLYLTSPRNIKGNGTSHTASLRITSPVARERSVSVTLCPLTTN
ncbi:serine/threonine-protein kinase [Nonomuraea rhizosphaerae]|uniref:serine/threonine-protein kinase n=1 Tax=Nonomuraea rhizosphaerae TaxID=2665663 RepID=UPI001C5DC271|nr:serine/threonine-protein kinase [Nonomuraea rhizosphaerae]